MSAAQLDGDEERVARVTEIVGQLWGRASCELAFDSPYQLLVATILSAQSTDERVNKVTPALFSRYPAPADLAGADVQELESLIHSTGFYRSKAKNLIGMAQKVTVDHAGEIPRTLDELIALPGVARKTANVVLGTAFGIPSGFVVDTHVSRVSQRLGLTRSQRPEAIERDLQAAIPRERWIDLGHQLIWHGRYLCKARRPACERCDLAPLCPSASP